MALEPSDARFCTRCLRARARLGTAVQKHHAVQKHTEPHTYCTDVLYKRIEGNLVKYDFGNVTLLFFPSHLCDASHTTLTHARAKYVRVQYARVGGLSFECAYTAVREPRLRVRACARDGRGTEAAKEKHTHDNDKPTTRFVRSAACPGIKPIIHAVRSFLPTSRHVASKSHVRGASRRARGAPAASVALVRWMVAPWFASAGAQLERASVTVSLPFILRRSPPSVYMVSRRRTCVVALCKPQVVTRFDHH